MPPTAVGLRGSFWYSCLNHQMLWKQQLMSFFRVTHLLMSFLGLKVRIEVYHLMCPKCKHLGEHVHTRHAHMHTQTYILYISVKSLYLPLSYSCCLPVERRPRCNECFQPPISYHLLQEDIVPAAQQAMDSSKSMCWHSCTAREGRLCRGTDQ